MSAKGAQRSSGGDANRGVSIYDRAYAVAVGDVDSDASPQHRLLRTLALWISSALGLFLSMFLLTKSNLFTPIPWQHDDYNNILPWIGATAEIRPVSTIGLHLLAMISPRAIYVALLVLTITLITCATRVVIRWLGLRLAATAECLLGLSVGCLVGLADMIPLALRYTGSFTHLLSFTLAASATLFGFDYISVGSGGFQPASDSIPDARGTEAPAPRRPRAAKWMLFVLFAFAVFAKEDVPAFVCTALFLWAAIEYRHLRDRAILRRGAAAVITVIVLTLVVLTINYLQKSSFVNSTLSGSAGYGLSTTPAAIFAQVARYLSFGYVLRAVAVVFAVSAILLLLRFTAELRIRYWALGAVILAMILPYALLAESHTFDYYTIIWLPLLASAALAGAFLFFSSLPLPPRALAIVSLIAVVAFISLVQVKSRQQRNAIADWVTMHQRMNRRILRGLDRNKAKLAAVSTVYVRGIDEGFSPFFFTGGEYAGYRVGNRKIKWVILMRPGSFMETSYTAANFSREGASVSIRDDHGEDVRPLLQFDAKLRATFYP